MREINPIAKESISNSRPEGLNFWGCRGCEGGVLGAYFL